LRDFVTDSPLLTPYTERTNHEIRGDGEMNALVNFLASSTGRIVRIVAGLALIAWGLLSLGGTIGIVVAVIGVVPLAAGLLDFCIFAPLFGRPLSGPKIRANQ
jgi:Inner membrane protein YgaP-like, transmembrane domain